MTNPNDPAFSCDRQTQQCAGITKRELATINSNIPWETAYSQLALDNPNATDGWLTVERIAAYRAKLMVIQADALIAELAKEK